MKKAKREKKPILIYCVEREGAEGLEIDLFLEESLAEEWSEHIGGSYYSEFTIGRTILDELKID